MRNFLSLKCYQIVRFLIPLIKLKNNCKFLAQHNYVAFGISQSRSMADASVVECVHFGGTVSAFASWNYAITNSRENVVSLNFNQFKK